MERSRRRRREFEIFNFSFLDVLACIIGLLIFILTIVVISGGGTSSHRREAAMRESEKAVGDAEAAANVAQQRRARLETLLNQRASAVVDPASYAKEVQSQIDLVGADKRSLEDASAKVDARIIETGVLVGQAKDAAAQGSSQISALDAQSRQFDQRAAKLLAQAAAAAQTNPGLKQDVKYYLPHVHETDRTPLLAEISGGRIWFLESGDYDRIPIDVGSSRLRRKADASGWAVADIVSGTGTLPPELRHALPGERVLSVSVRPDGFAAFRQLREWAWKQGYGVNWLPFRANEPIILTKTSHIVEQ